MNVTFEQLVTLYKRIEFLPNSSVGSLLLEGQNDCDLVESLIDDQEQYGIAIEGGTVEPGNTVTLLVTAPRTKLGLFFKDTVNLLSSPKHQSVEPDNYFILSSKFSKLDQPVPDFILNYRTILSFLELLKEGSAYFDTNLYHLVFLGEEVFKLPVRYNSETVAQLDRNTLELFIICFNEDTHKEQKIDILVKSIQLISDGIDTTKIFEHILQNLTQLKEQFAKGYRVFASGFSYDKIMDQLRTAKVEEMGKIHKTFSDIQNHVLGIPIATIIVATQMKEASSWQAQGITNTAILFGCFAFVCLVFLVLCNQTQTLKAISEELKHKRQQVDKEYASIKNDIDGVFSTIKKRLCIQRWAFRVIGIVLTVGFLSTLLIYCLLTKPVYYYLYANSHWFAALADFIK